jgi:glutamine---fructose-6-phosphate transaminase (isomerizing)
MCGIFGIIASKESQYSLAFLNKSLRTLAKLSERRGKDSSGLCLFNQKEGRIDVVKGPLEVSELLKNKKVTDLINKALSPSNLARYAFGHARLVTNGTQLNDDNNQPVIKDGAVGIHNGIIVNVNELWDKRSDIKRKFEIDTEVLLSLIKSNFKTSGSIEKASSEAINDVFGTVSAALVFDDLKKFILATNNGSLYIISNQKDFVVFASEKYIINEFQKKIDLKVIGDYESRQIKANEALSIDLDNFSLLDFSLSSDDYTPTNQIAKVYIKELAIPSEKKQLSTVIDLNLIHLNRNAEREKSILCYPIDKIKALKRCTKCLLPSTFPYIDYDDHGVCNYCKSYKKKNLPKSLDELAKLVEPYRKANGKADVLLPFSGGRDSTYVLHVVKKELGLNPIAYTYDWGMVTDLARRNVARICGELGVENIIVAANMHWKRENIRKNISSWLKSPQLGMIPLFMAGDKFFFYYAHKIKKQLGIDLEIWGVNELENTNFKTGFAGLKPQFDKERIYSISLANKLKLFSFVGQNILKSPGYFNQSVLDSLGSFASRYMITKTDYYHLFDYIYWDEEHIEDTIISNYKWETAVDSSTTWRIGDGTASFYNYIYTLVAGFSENDTFRSNQIREGMITRDEALKLIYEENKPRYNSLKWYLKIIGLDYESTIKRINSMPRMYNYNKTI